MRNLRLLPFAALGLLAGCGSTPQSTNTPTYPNLTGNWQIQSGLTTPTPTFGVLLLGALQNSGAQVTGTFRFTNLAQPFTCGVEQVVTLTGSVDAKGNLALTSAALADGSVITVNLLDPAIAGSFAAGTIEVTGSSCAVASGPALGIQFASLTGTFQGALTPGSAALPGTGTAGTGSLALAQSATPAADGQFPVTGTLAYTFGACSGSLSLTGTVSGVGLQLGSAPAPPSPNSFLGTISIDGTKITADVITFSPAPCSTAPVSAAIYNGALVRQ